MSEIEDTKNWKNWVMNKNKNNEWGYINNKTKQWISKNEHNKLFKDPKTNNNEQVEYSLTDIEERSFRTKKQNKTFSIPTQKKSLRRYIFKTFKNTNLYGSRQINLISLANTGDQIIKEKEIYLLNEICKIQKVIPKRRSEISDWKSRKLPKVRAGGMLWYLDKDKPK